MFAPLLLVLVGLASFAVATVIGIAALVAVGVICFLLAGLLFVTAPMIAMFKGQMYENRPTRPTAAARRTSRFRRTRRR